MKPRLFLLSLLALIAVATPTLHVAYAETTTDTQVSQANNLSTQSCGVALILPDYLERNVDDDQSVEHADYEKWDIDHVPSENEDDLKEVTVSGTAGPTGGTLTLQIISGSAKINGKVWLDRKKKQKATNLSWSVSPDSTHTETLFIEGYEPSDSVGDVKFKAKISCPSGLGSNGVNYAAAAAEDVQETTVYQVDLDVDSLNDNENPYAASGYTDDEDKIEASDKLLDDGLKRPGKVVMAYPKMNSDGDLVPDFADGFNLDVGERQIPDLSDVTSDLKFVPVQIELKKPLDPAVATIKFEYEESKPEVSDKGIEITGTGTDLDPYKFVIKKGGMRLWKKKAEERTSGANAPDGDFVPANEDIKWSDLAGGTGRTATLYIEYVDTNEREAIGRKTIVTTATQGVANCTDEIVVTLLPMELALVELTEDGGLIKQIDPIIEMNEAAPQFEISTPTVSTISYGANGLAAQIALSGTVKSKSCDAVMGEMGTIKEVVVSAQGTDGYDEVNMTVNTTISKGEGGNGVYAYPFSGQIQLPASPVGLTEGVNVVTVEAQDPISLEMGKTSLAFNVTTVGGNTSLPQFSGDGLGCRVLTFADETIDQATITYQVLGQATSITHELTETAAGSGIFTNEEEDIKLRVAVVEEETIAYLDREEWANEELEIPLKKVEDSEAYEGKLTAVSVSFAEGVENPGFSQVLLSKPRKVGESGKGEAKVYAIRLPGFEGLDVKIIEKYELNWGPDGETKFKLLRHQETGAILLENPIRPGFPLTILPRPSYSTAVNDLAAELANAPAEGSDEDQFKVPNRAKMIEEELLDAANDTLDFYKGLGVGFSRAGVDLVTGLGKAWVGGVTYAGEEFASGLNHLEFVLADLNWFGHGKHKERIRLQIDLAEREIAAKRKAVADTSKAIFDLWMWLNEAGADAVIAIFLRPVSAEQADFAHQRLGEKDQQILELATFLLDEVRETWPNSSAYDRGRYTGMIIFEISTSFLSVAKLGKLSKADVLLDLVKRKPPLPGGTKLMAKADELGKALKATRMCFVAGTLVLTAEGNVPIEKIEQGTLVWSRSDETGEMGWKRVVDTFITHPSELVSIDIDVDGDGKADDSITGTIEHPFWEVTNAEWVKMGELKTGDRLLNAQGTSSIHILSTGRHKTAHDGKLFTTYNFEVQDYHTYFVSKSGVWVHNAANAACEKMFLMLNRILDFKNFKGNIGKSYDETVHRLGNRLDQNLKSTFVEGILEDLPDLNKAGKLDPRISAYATEDGIFKANEAFLGSRFELRSGRKILDRAPDPGVDPITGNQLPRADFIDDLNRIWDGVGPLPKSAWGTQSRLEGFFTQISRHIDIPEKGNPIVDLAGLPDSLKQRAMDLVKSRLSDPNSMKIGAELLLDNGKKIILLGD